MFLGRRNFGLFGVVAACAGKHNRVETALSGLKSAHLKTLFALAVFSISSFGVNAGAQAWEGEWDQIVVWRQTKERGQYFPHSGLAISKVTRLIYLEDEQVDWETYQNLKKDRQVPRYMMRPPIGHFEKKNGP